MFLNLLSIFDVGGYQVQSTIRTRYKPGQKQIGEPGQIQWEVWANVVMTSEHR